MRKSGAAAPLLLLCLGCSGGGASAKATPPPKDLGTQAADVVSDTAVLREANAAAGQVVRNAGDCEAARAALPEASRKLEEAAAKLRTATGRQTLEALQKQLKTIGDACP